MVSIGLVRFDLAPVKDRAVQSATLQLFALRADLNQPARLVDLSLVTGPWEEKEATFNKRPPFTANPIATAAVYGGSRWYSWDVTESVVRPKEAGAVSYALGLRIVEEKKEEQVIFVSREAGDRGPRLVITYTTPPSSRWYFWVGGIVGAALLAFLGGGWLARRRRLGRG